MKIWLNKADSKFVRDILDIEVFALRTALGKYDELSAGASEEARRLFHPGIIAAFENKARLFEELAAMIVPDSENELDQSKADMIANAVRAAIRDDENVCTPEKYAEVAEVTDEMRKLVTLMMTGSEP